MNRALDIGPVSAAAFKTQSGKVRVRLLFTTEQLEALLAVAREPDETMKRDETQCNAPESEQSREEDDGDDVRARARAARHSVDPPPTRVFVIAGTRAWEAWLAYRARQGKPSCPTTSHVVDGRTREGWWFEALFPPGIQNTEANTTKGPGC